METQTRPRPNLSPVCIDREEYPRNNSFYSAHSSPLFSASLRTDGLPTVMLPASPGYDHAMRQHERAMVDSLDQRGRHFERQHSPGTARSLSPIVEQQSRSQRGSISSLPLPRVPVPSPLTPSFLQHPRRSTLAAETRSILLSGLPDDGLPRIVAPIDGLAGRDSDTDERRQSLSPSFPAPASRRNSRQLQNELHAWGHVFLGNGSEADCFVAAVALRRPSENSSADEGSAAKFKTPEQSNKVTVRVRVRPCALDRQPFLLTRTFDMNLLRATLPEPAPVLGGPRRTSADHGSRNTLPPERRRSSVTVRGEPSPGRDSTYIRSTNTVPIHRPYAFAFFPVLAALLYNKHIQPRDIIDLPLPHPEAWGSTVAHVYTGQGELTEPIRQNILYLGGKV
ncbi:hypothetical protein QBC35DRAFT_279934 [Podospora australis]|uniref:Uncharacterized protein n=1 Tax=Podospora australis TaxID=1536484 RepID=A0AAN7AMT5_9PEZI|nr:hypothetical protein QBC35DRAFT_279934 [Podospora australis]